MKSILVLMGLFLMVPTSGRTADVSDFGEKADVWRWNVEDYPNPQLKPKFCQRFSPSTVCDPDSVLSKEQVADLDMAIRRLYNDTPCFCPECSESSGGIVIGIAVMKRIFLPYNEHHSIVIREFAEELRKQWSLGECNNEIVIVLVTEDRMSSTSVGPGISSYISPQESRIFHENKGYFTIGDYYKGLLSMVQAYYNLSQSIKLEKDIDEANIGLIIGVVIGVVLFMVLIILVGCTLRRRMMRTPSFRKDSWDGDPSLSWKKKTYQACRTQEVKEKVVTEKRSHPENNNDQVINTGRQEHISDEKGDETMAQNETLLTTVAELENEDNRSSGSEGDEDHESPIVNANGKTEPEQYSEPGASSFAPRATYTGTVTFI